MIRQFHICTLLIYEDKQHQKASHSDVQDQSFIVTIETQYKKEANSKMII